MQLVEFILHIDAYLELIIDQLGILVYGVLFLIVFAETGLVIVPFLPGDSLLFAAGALAGGGLLNLSIAIPTLIAAAILGDAVNYYIGSRLGPRVFAKENRRFFNPESLQKTQNFYDKYGGKTIIIARFLPIVRTFAPFVAGIGQMKYSTFLFYNVIGAFIWVLSLTLVGYFFGQIPVIKENFEYAVLTIIAVSVVPVILESLRHRRNGRAAASEDEQTSYAEIEETFEKEHLRED